MSRVVIKADYVKPTNKNRVTNYLVYIATREGVEMLQRTGEMTDRDQARLESLLEQSGLGPDNEHYTKYLEDPSKKNAKQLVRHMMEQQDSGSNIGMYMNYVANRPNVDRSDNIHGLFDQNGLGADLNQAVEEAKRFTGNVHRFYISMKREDAVSTGYDNAAAWQRLISSNILAISEKLGIPVEQLKWTGAFHDESYHPHVHFTFYSDDTRYGFIRQKNIDDVKSLVVNKVFKDELKEKYQVKQESRESLEKSIKNEISRLYDEATKNAAGKNVNANSREFSVIKMNLITGASSIQIKGKPYYEFQTLETKKQIDEIAKKVIESQTVKPLFEKLYQSQLEINKFYAGEDKSISFEQFKRNYLVPNKSDRKVIHNLVLKAVSDIQKNQDVARKLISDADLKNIRARLPRALKSYDRDTVASAITKGLLSVGRSETDISQLVKNTSIEGILGEITAPDQQVRITLDEYRVITSVFRDGKAGAIKNQSRVNEHCHHTATSRLMMGALHLLKNQAIQNEMVAKKNQENMEQIEEDAKERKIKEKKKERKNVQRI